jgi:hypothetical protein
MSEQDATGLYHPSGVELQRVGIIRVGWSTSNPRVQRMLKVRGPWSRILASIMCTVKSKWESRCL